MDGRRKIWKAKIHRICKVLKARHTSSGNGWRCHHIDDIPGEVLNADQGIGARRCVLREDEHGGPGKSLKGEVQVHRHNRMADLLLAIVTNDGDWLQERADLQGEFLGILNVEQGPSCSSVNETQEGGVLVWG